MHESLVGVTAPTSQSVIEMEHNQTPPMFRGKAAEQRQQDNGIKSTGHGDRQFLAGPQEATGENVAFDVFQQIAHEAQARERVKSEQEGTFRYSLAACERSLNIEAMKSDELRQLLRGAAFRPFTVFANGKSFLIEHPEFAALTRPGGTLIVFHKSDNGFDLVGVDLIARAEVHDPRRKKKRM